MQTFDLRTCDSYFVILSLTSVYAEVIIFSLKEGIEEILNLQPRGPKAKVYQVKQVRNVFLKYKLGGDTDEEV
jgi:hypothetical protein